MKRAAMLNSILSAAALVALTLTPSMATAASAAPTGCQYANGFKVLHDLIPDIVGDCAGPEMPSLEGTTQQTARGLLSYSGYTRVNSFTDGNQTWLNGPFGVQQRFNDQRYKWELLFRSGEFFGDNVFLVLGSAPTSPWHHFFEEGMAGARSLVGSSPSKMDMHQPFRPGVMDGVSTSPSGFVTGPGFTLQLQPYWNYVGQTLLDPLDNYPRSPSSPNGFRFLPEQTVLERIGPGLKPSPPNLILPEGLTLVGHQPAPTRPAGNIVGDMDAFWGAGWDNRVAFTTDAGAQAIAAPGMCSVWYFIPGPHGWVWAQYHSEHCPDSNGKLEYVKQFLAPPDPLHIIMSIRAT